MSNLFAEDFFLLSIFVSDVEDAALRSGYEASYDHAFDHQMWQMCHDETVFDCAGLALVCVANHKLHRIGLFPHQVPFHAGGKTGPPMPRSSAVFSWARTSSQTRDCASLRTTPYLSPSP